MNIYVALIAGSLAIVSTILSIWLKQIYDKKNRLEVQLSDKKRAVYLHFLSVFAGSLFPQDQTEKLSQEEMVKEMRKFLLDALLWASPQVIKQYKDFQKAAKNSSNNTKAIIKPFFSVFLSIRDDLGLDNKDLGWEDLAHLIINKDVERSKAEQKTGIKENIKTVG